MNENKILSDAAEKYSQKLRSGEEIKTEIEVTKKEKIFREYKSAGKQSYIPQRVEKWTLLSLSMH